MNETNATAASHLDELSRRWRQGERVLVEHYLDQQPDLQPTPPLVLDLLYQEICLREQRGEQPELEEYLQRFPHLAASLRQQFEVHRALAGALVKGSGPGRQQQVAPAPLCEAAASSHPVIPAEQTGTRLPVSTSIGPPKSDVRPELYAFLAPGQQEGEIGRLGPYRVLKVLGAGGMGIVFQAEDPQLKRTVALKALLPSVDIDPSARQRFLREAQAAAAVEHDHIVHIYQVGEDRGVPFLAMQLLKGESLEARLQRERSLPMPEVLRIGREVALGLAAAHVQRLIHRDIKPANLWLEAGGGRVKILDFGLARAATDTLSVPPSGTMAGTPKADHRSSGRNSERLTELGAIVGTPGYMAPEQACGAEVDSRSDLFSLGCVLYRLCTGQMPFKSRDIFSLLTAALTEEPKPPQELNPKVPAALSSLVMQLLAKSPAQRPPSAQLVAKILEAIEKGKDPFVPPPPRRRQRWLIGAAVLLLGIGFAGYQFAPAVYRFATNQGQVVVEVDDEDVEVVVKQGGQQIKIIDTKSGREINLKAGSYQIELAAGKERLNLSTNQFDLERNGRVIVKVRMETAAAKKLPAIAPDAKDQAAADLQTLLARENAPNLDPNQLRMETLGFIQKHRGTPQAVKAAGLLGRLPSPLDQFTRETISPYELAVAGNGDPKLAPAELVAILGDSRLRHWGRGARATFSPDGKILASLAYDGVLKLWDADTGNELGTLPGSFMHPHVPAFSPDGKTLAATTSDGWVTVWDVGMKKEKRIFPIRSKGGAISFAFHPTKKVLAIGDVEGLVKLFSTETGDELRALDFKGAVLNMIAFSPDGELIAATSNWSGIVKMWQTETGNALHTLEGKHGAIPCIMFSPDGKTLATAGDHLIKWWDPKTGKQLKSIPAHANRIWGLAYSPDGEKLASGSWDGAIKVWNAKTGKQEQSMSAPAPIVSLAFHRDNNTVATGHNDGTIRLWDSTTGKELHTKPVTFLFSLAFRGDSQVLMVGGASSGKTGSLQLWPMIPGKPARALPVTQEGSIIPIACSPDDRTLAAGGVDGTVHLWDLGKEAVFATITGSGGRVLAVAFSPDGKLLAIGTDNPVVKLCDAVKGEVWLRLHGHTGLVSSLAFSPDGKTLASASEDKTIILWDVASGKKNLALTGHNGTVHCLAFSPDGKELVSGSAADKTVNLWDLSTGQVHRTLEGFAGSVAYSPDGQLLASVGDGKVCLRDAGSGKTLHTYQLGPPGGEITRVTFSPEGRYLATANWNSTVYILRLPARKEVPK